MYDESRGGADRAEGRGRAVARIAPPPGTLLDLGGGTGIVSAELAALGYDVLVADRSAGMLDLAARRLPGRVLRATADRLPVRDALRRRGRLRLAAAPARRSRSWTPSSPRRHGC